MAHKRPVRTHLDTRLPREMPVRATETSSVVVITFVTTRPGVQLVAEASSERYGSSGQLQRLRHLRVDDPGLLPVGSHRSRVWLLSRGSPESTDA